MTNPLEHHSLTGDWNRWKSMPSACPCNLKFNLDVVFAFSFAPIWFHFGIASFLLPSCGLHSVRPSRINFVFADSISYLLIGFTVADSILYLLNQFTFATFDLQIIENHWKSMEIIEKQIKSMKINENQWWDPISNFQKIQPWFSNTGFIVNSLIKIAFLGKFRGGPL